MNSNEDSLSGAEDFIEAEIEASHLDSPAAEMEVRAAMDKLPGIARLDISHGKVSVRYDPTLTSQKQIAEGIAVVGHPVQKMEISRDEGHAGNNALAPSEPWKGE